MGPPRPTRRAEPERGIDDQVNPASYAGRNQFVDSRIDGRVLSPDTRPGKCAKYRIAT